MSRLSMRAMEFIDYCDSVNRESEKFVLGVLIVLEHNKARLEKGKRCHQLRSKATKSKQSRISANEK